jgi:hypothetical protein
MFQSGLLSRYAAAVDAPAVFIHGVIDLMFAA